MRSREVITLLTIRVSSSNTLAMTCCSRWASTPARAPASVMARMSAEVIFSSRCMGIPSSLKSRSVLRVNSQTSGLKVVISTCIGPTMRTASRSGSFMPRRLGNRSAKTRNTAMIVTNEAPNADALRAFGAQPVLEQGRVVGAERAFADHAAEDGDGVQADLHHGEVVAGLLLQAHDAFGAQVALVRHLPQPQAPRGGKADFGEREEGAGRDQRGDDEQALSEVHGPVNEGDMVPRPRGAP